jgi:hypothetical protein
LENQFFLPDLPPEFRASPPPQRQRRIPLHPTGQNWNHAVDKGKAVITHVPSATVAPPQTLATGINQQLPMGEAMNLNLSPQQLQAYETLLALGILDGSSAPDPVTLDHLMECLDLQTPLHFPEPSPVNVPVNPPVLPYLFLLPPYHSLNLILQPNLRHLHPPPLRQLSLRHHHTRVPHHIPALPILLLCSHPPRAIAETQTQSFDIESPPPAELTQRPHQLQIVHRLHASELPRHLLRPSLAPVTGTRHRSTLIRSAPTLKSHHLPLSGADPTTAPGSMSPASVPVFRRRLCSRSRIAASGNVNDSPPTLLPQPRAPRSSTVCPWIPRRLGSTPLCPGHHLLLACQAEEDTVPPPYLANDIEAPPL